MKTELTYQKAYEELTKILNEIEGEKIQLDKLSEKMLRAKELLTFCKNKLREVEDSFEDIQR